MTEHLSATPPNTATEFLETYSRMMTTLLEEHHTTEESLSALVTVARWHAHGVPAWSGNAATTDVEELADKVQQGLAAWIQYRTDLEEHHDSAEQEPVSVPRALGAEEQ